MPQQEGDITLTKDTASDPTFHLIGSGKGFNSRNSSRLGGEGKETSQGNGCVGPGFILARLSYSNQNRLSPLLLFQ